MMLFEVVKSFEGDLGNGPQTVAKGMQLELDPAGEVNYWLAMGWIKPVKKAAETTAKEVPEKAVKPRARARSSTTRRSRKKE